MRSRTPSQTTGRAARLCTLLCKLYAQIGKALDPTIGGTWWPIFATWRERTARKSGPSQNVSSHRRPFSPNVSRAPTISSWIRGRRGRERGEATDRFGGLAVSVFQSAAIPPGRRPTKPANRSRTEQPTQAETGKTNAPPTPDSWRRRDQRKQESRRPFSRATISAKEKQRTSERQQEQTTLPRPIIIPSVKDRGFLWRRMRTL